jgi:hypothetical protein
MADYDISSIEHEALLLIVASTFGNGGIKNFFLLIFLKKYKIPIRCTGKRRTICARIIFDENERK